MFQVNFLPWRMKQLKVRYRFWRNLFLLKIIFLIIITLVLSLSWRNEHQQQRLSLAALLQQQAALQAVYLATQQEAARLQRIKSRRKVYQREEKQAQRYVVLLQSLSRLIPNNCWLVKLEQQNNAFILDGISEDYATIVAFSQRMAAEDNLFNIQLNDVTQQDSGYVHFVMHVNWREEKYTNE